jgi:transposase-like protein
MEDSGHIPVWTGQRVERTNAGGRHRYCEPFKTWVVEQALTPGMSTAGLAMRNQINANQLRRWMLLHRRREGVVLPQRLLPVADQAPRVTGLGQQEPGIEIELGGAVVRVRQGVDAEALRTVLDVLRGPMR